MTLNGVAREQSVGFTGPAPPMNPPTWNWRLACLRATVLSSTAMGETAIMYEVSAGGAVGLLEGADEVRDEVDSPLTGGVDVAGKEEVDSVEEVTDSELEMDDKDESVGPAVGETLVGVEDTSVASADEVVVDGASLVEVELVETVAEMAVDSSVEAELVASADSVDNEVEDSLVDVTLEFGVAELVGSRVEVGSAVEVPDDSLELLEDSEVLVEEGFSLVDVSVVEIELVEVSLIEVSVAEVALVEVSLVEDSVVEVSVIVGGSVVEVDSLVVEVDSVEVGDSVVDEEVVVGSGHSPMIDGIASGPAPTGTTFDPQSTAWARWMFWLSQSKTTYAARRKVSPRVGSPPDREC